MKHGFFVPFLKFQCYPMFLHLESDVLKLGSTVLRFHIFLVRWRCPFRMSVFKRSKTWIRLDFWTIQGKVGSSKGIDRKSMEDVLKLGSTVLRFHIFLVRWRCPFRMSVFKRSKTWIRLDFWMIQGLVGSSKGIDRKSMERTRPQSRP
jgi:uncharacterized C2H2 Zn-finger protein